MIYFFLLAFLALLIYYLWPIKDQLKLDSQPETQDMYRMVYGPPNAIFRKEGRPGVQVCLQLGGEYTLYKLTRVSDLSNGLKQYNFTPCGSGTRKEVEEMRDILNGKGELKNQKESD